jgi:hypothetical protein
MLIALCVPVSLRQSIGHRRWSPSDVERRGKYQPEL